MKILRNSLCPEILTIHEVFWSKDEEMKQKRRLKAKMDFLRFVIQSCLEEVVTVLVREGQSAREFGQPIGDNLVVDGTQLIIVNNCKESIWPGILGTAGHPTPQEGGFHLPSGEQLLFDVPENWSGRIWGRQGCCFDPSTGKGSCQTGDCAGILQCRGLGGVPPATLVEMTLATPKSALHFYDVSLVDGFNVPVSMVPIGGSGDGCGVAACEADLNVCCPLNLVVKKQGRVVGCKSACLAAKSDRYCCTGEFADSKSCKPSVFGHLFKAICPRAYSYAFDDSTGLKTCMASRYVITFCPPKLG